MTRHRLWSPCDIRYRSHLSWDVHDTPFACAKVMGLEDRQISQFNYRLPSQVTDAQIYLCIAQSIEGCVGYHIQMTRHSIWSPFACTPMHHLCPKFQKLPGPYIYSQIKLIRKFKVVFIPPKRTQIDWGDCEVACWHIWLFWWPKLGYGILFDRD